MTEAEWLACAEPHPMLWWLRKRRKHRKHRLFAVACCRDILSLFNSPSFHQAIEVAERYADQQTTPEELQQVKALLNSESSDLPCLFRARSAVLWALDYPMTATKAELCAAHAADAVRHKVEPDGLLSGLFSEHTVSIHRAKQKEQTDWLRDIFPFSMVSLNPSLKTADAVYLSEAAYLNRLPQTWTLCSNRLSILADALEDAGSSDDAILTHLRSPGPHVRGCWALDLILGKQ